MEKRGYARERKIRFPKISAIISADIPIFSNAMHVEHHSFSADHPEWADKIHALKVSDPHFASLVAEHEKLDKEICRLEEDPNNTSTDAEMEELKKNRLHLADHIIAAITA